MPAESQGQEDREEDGKRRSLRRLLRLGGSARISQPSQAEASRVTVVQRYILVLTLVHAASAPLRGDDVVLTLRYVPTLSRPPSSSKLPSAEGTIGGAHVDIEQVFKTARERIKPISFASGRGGQSCLGPSQPPVLTLDRD